MQTELDKAEEMVTQESARFRAALPKLLSTIRGRFVVFKDGKVQSDHATMPEAYEAGIAKYGLYGGMVIELVEEPKLRQVSPSVLHGWKR